jgi:hypothetical protein
VPFNIKENRDVVEAYIPPKHETPGKLTVQYMIFRTWCLLPRKI